MPEFVTHCTHLNSHLMAHLQANRAEAALAWMEGLKARGVVDEFSLTPASLEDVYVELVGREAEAGAMKEQQEAVDASAA